MTETERNEQLIAFFPQISAQMRSIMMNIHHAFQLLAPLTERDRDADLDQTASELERSYYQLLRLSNNLSHAEDLFLDDAPAPTTNDVVGFCRELVERCEVPAELLGLRIRFSSNKPYHYMNFYPMGLERIVMNLVSNAMKYTPEGGYITLSLQIQPHPKQMVLSVRDTGCGIPKEKQEKLFSLTPLTAKEYRIKQGVGLGLPLSFQMARRMGGTLVLAESVEGKGSCFLLRLSEDDTITPAAHDLPVDYAGGFNPTLLQLADALPTEAYLAKYLD